MSVKMMIKIKKILMPIMKREVKSKIIQRKVMNIILVKVIQVIIVIVTTAVTQNQRKKKKRHYINRLMDFYKIISNLLSGELKII